MERVERKDKKQPSEHHDDNHRFKEGNKAAVGNKGGNHRSNFITQQLIAKLNRVCPRDRLRRTHLLRIIDALVQQAEFGSTPAFLAICNRVEGMPKQKVDLGGNVTIRSIQLEVIDPKPQEDSPPKVIEHQPSSKDNGPFTDDGSDYRPPLRLVQKT